MTATDTASPRVTLRRATEDDVAFLVALRHRTMDRHFEASGLAITEDEHLRRVRARFDCAQIVLVEGHAAGLLKLSCDDRQWHLIQIQVAPEFQGQGIGARLLDDVVARSRAAGASIDLDVLKVNPARRLYARAGFVPIAEDAHSIDMRLPAPRTAAGVEPATPRALLFDLGGVLIEYDFGRALAQWQAYSALHPDEMRRVFVLDEHHHKHERGELDADEFFGHLAEQLQLSAGIDEIRRGWNAIFIREIAATRALVEAVRPAIACYAFTNTNAAHMEAWSTLYPPVVRTFDRIFASHEMGRRKPERAAFEHVCRAIGVEPGAVVFFDDLPENVAGAQDAGLQAVLVRSPADVAVTLRQLDLLPAHPAGT